MASYSFDRFEIDADAFELRENGEKRHVEPLVFDLILYFVRNAGRVVSREEIIEHVWDGRIVSEATVSSAIKSMRRALGDSGQSQSCLTTIRGRGFRFDVNVVQTGQATDKPPAETEPLNSNRAAATPGRDPSLAVLPFQTYGNADELSAVADGLVENLTTILTRIPLLKVTSRLMAAKLAERGPGTSYMIEGSVQNMGNDLRVNVQLIETKSGFHLWAQHFDHPSGDEAVTGLLHAMLPRLEPQIVKAMFNDLGGDGGEMNSRQTLLQAINILTLKGWNPDSFSQSAAMLRQSIALDPREALGHAYLALTLALGQRVGMFEHTDEILAEAFEEVEIALDLDRMDSNVLGLAGCALADGGDPDRGIPVLLNAIELNPNNAQALAALGAAQMIAGNQELAIRYLSQGIAISPMDGRLAIWRATLACAYLFAGDTDSAIEEARRARDAGSRIYLPHLVLAAAHLARGDEDKAARSAADAFTIAPNLSEQQISTVIGPEFAAKLGELKRL